MKIFTYLQETRLELMKVTWPSRELAIKMTSIVIFSSLIVGLYIGGLDFLFTNVLGILFK